MEASRFTTYVSQLCEWIMRMAYLNILWILFSVLGLGLFGIIPATTAVFAIQRKWLKEEEKVPILSTFWREYRNNFVMSNLLGLIIAVIGWIIYFDLKFFVSKEELLFQLISLVIFTFSIWYMVVLIYIFPVFAHYELKLFQNIKFAFSLGVINPFLTLGAASCGGGILYFVLAFPKLLPFFGISLPCFVLTIFTSQALRKVEKKKALTPATQQKSVPNPKHLLAKQFQTAINMNSQQKGDGELNHK